MKARVVAAKRAFAFSGLHPKATEGGFLACVTDVACRYETTNQETRTALTRVAGSYSVSKSCD